MAVKVYGDEDATRIFESRAIARCLVAKYGKDSTLVPSPADPKAYGLFEQEASIEYSSFDPTASGVYLENLHARIEDREPDTTLVEKNCQALLAKFEAYDRVLSKQKYLGGDVFALADLFRIPYGKAIQSYAPGTFDSQPNVKRWWAEITARESWKAVADLR
ncbi:Glutathione S-transferase PM239X14 [Rhizoctonia solani]|uniref:glutathione transferase n=1 Tax=Rhizoctonia solani TaxID=456999 RepID=A0A0K6GFC8_9AGAM|nr:Glutathione S-transferase PM239X14 [Rhizoctonia solani]